MSPITGLERLYSACLLLLVGSTLLSTWVRHPWLHLIAGGLAAVTLVITYLLPHRRLAPLLLTAGATGLFAWYGQFPVSAVLARQLTVNSLVALLVLVPFMGAFFNSRRYVDAIGVLIARAPGGRAYAVLTFAAHLVGSVLNVATVPVLYEALGRTRRLSTPEGQRLFSQAVAHGFITSSFWSPNFATLTLSLQLTGIRFTDVLPTGIAMAVLVMGINIARGWISFRNLPVDPEADAPASPAMDPQRAARLRCEFGLISLSFLAGVVIVESLTGISILIVVPVLAVTYAVAAFLATGMGSQLAAEVGRFALRLSQRRGEVAIFLSSGLLAAAISETPAGKQFLAGFDAISQALSLGPAATIPLAITLLAFLGLPPLISVLFLASVLSQNLSSYPPLLTVLSLTTGISVGHVSAPFATTTMMLVATLRRTPWQIVRWNFGYGIMLFILMQIVAWFL